MAKSLQCMYVVGFFVIFLTAGGVVTFVTASEWWQFLIPVLAALIARFIASEGVLNMKAPCMFSFATFCVFAGGELIAATMRYDENFNANGIFFSYGVSASILLLGAFFMYKAFKKEVP